MIDLATFGGAAAGLTWGWAAGWQARPAPRRPWRGGLTVILATALAGGEVLWLGGGEALAAFAFAAAAALSLHAILLGALSRRPSLAANERRGHGD